MTDDDNGNDHAGQGLASLAPATRPQDERPERTPAGLLAEALRDQGPSALDGVDMTDVGRVAELARVLFRGQPDADARAETWTAAVLTRGVDRAEDLRYGWRLDDNREADAQREAAERGAVELLRAAAEAREAEELQVKVAALAEAKRVADAARDAADAAREARRHDSAVAAGLAWREREARRDGVAWYGVDLVETTTDTRMFSGKGKKSDRKAVEKGRGIVSWPTVVVTPVACRRIALDPMSDDEYGELVDRVTDLVYEIADRLDEPRRTDDKAPRLDLRLVDEGARWVHNPASGVVEALDLSLTVSCAPHVLKADRLFDLVFDTVVEARRHVFGDLIDEADEGPAATGDDGADANESGDPNATE